MTQLPFFVYGTLRSGRRNYSCFLQGVTVGEVPARVFGVEMHALTLPYPYVIRAGEESSVVGELMTPAPSAYEKVMGALDDLEGHPDHYVRTQMTAITEHGVEVPCWIYLAAEDYGFSDKTRIPSGDWDDAIKRVASYGFVARLARACLRFLHPQRRQAGTAGI